MRIMEIELLFGFLILMRIHFPSSFVVFGFFPVFLIFSAKNHIIALQ